MRVVILFGTESGTAEFAAQDVADHLAPRIPVTLSDLADYPVADLGPGPLYIVICSTYDEGGLPASARPFHESLMLERPDLTGMRYAMFGLGDSAYEDTYSHGSEIIDTAFRELGAERVADYGRHDASSRDVASDAAIDWAERLTNSFLVSISGDESVDPESQNYDRAGS